MSALNTRLHIRAQHGFTLVELMIAIALASLVVSISIALFGASINQYLDLHKNSVAFGNLANESQRVAKVIRGLTDITQAEANEMTFYAYFAPQDAVVSQVHYYKNASGTALMADVTPLSAPLPDGTPVTANKKTYTIIDNLSSNGGASLFEYLDSGGGTLSQPVTDLNIIKNVKINLAVPEGSSNSSMVLQVNLRNRKTNL